MHISYNIMHRAAVALASAVLFCLPCRAYELLSDTLRHSAIYPGTFHTYTVSIPDGYDPAEPACLYVGLDGMLYNAAAVMDSLTAAGKMPRTIGVYLQPGIIYNDSCKVVRYNRSNEFDAIDSRLARFIADELLPAALSLTTSDGRPLCINPSPDCHAISGASSGGIAAFVAAWTRPDLFRRVYATCGTFVAMRGGDQLAALVRKTEPKPLRIALHDGSRDAWNPLFGHWYEQNRLLASSLEFAGYDLFTRWDDGTHSIRLGAALFPEVMEWLWRDYPAPIVAGESQNDFLPSILVMGEDWTAVSESKVPTTAPCQAMYPTGEYLVAPMGQSPWLTATCVESDGTFGPAQKAYLLHDPTFCGPDIAGMAFDSLGNLYVATSSGLQIADQNGRVRAILPWPLDVPAQAFAFDGNTLFVKLQGQWYARRVATPTATPGPIKSQGQA